MINYIIIVGFFVLILILLMIRGLYLMGLALLSFPIEIWGFLLQNTVLMLIGYLLLALGIMLERRLKNL